MDVADVNGLSRRHGSCLRLFMERLEELLESEVVNSSRQSIGAIAEYSFGQTTEFTVVLDGFEDTVFTSFIATFRQFTMPKEQAVYIGDICEIVISNCDRNVLKDWVQYAKLRWETLLAAKPSVKFNINGIDYSNKGLLNLWLYGGRFHTDINKAKKWDGMTELEQQDAVLSIQALMPKLVNCLVIVGTVIRCWMNESDEEIPQPPEIF